MEKGNWKMEEHKACDDRPIFHFPISVFHGECSLCGMG